MQRVAAAMDYVACLASPSQRASGQPESKMAAVAALSSVITRPARSAARLPAKLILYMHMWAADWRWAFTLLQPVVLVLVGPCPRSVAPSPSAHYNPDPDIKQNPSEQNIR